jgi:sulfoxide reductase heme-binding subunit YedZ
MRAWPLPRRTVEPPPAAGDLLVAFLVATAVFFTVIVVASAYLDFALSPLTWYVSRASGLVLYIASWLTVVTGLAMTTRLVRRDGVRALLLSAHAYAFHLWYGFLLLHVVSIAIDPYVGYGAQQLLVPFADGGGEPWIGLGIVAAQLMLVVGGSALLRRLLGYPVWRALHMLSFPAFAMGLAHGYGAGTDSGNILAVTLYITTAASVVFLTVYRLLRLNAREMAKAERQSHARKIVSVRVSSDHWQRDG